MRIPVAKYAVERFHSLQEEYAGIIDAMGMGALMCLIRQRGTDSDNGWACFEIGITDDGAFWGKFNEKRGESPKQVMIVIDLEDIDSIEFEIYDGKMIER